MSPKRKKLRNKRTPPHQPAANQSSSGTSDRPLLHIPWLRMRTRIITHSILQDTVCRNTTEDKQQLVVAMCNAIPTYLPAKYHQMRCEIPKSAKLTAALKKQWDAAFQFVHTCSTFDHYYLATAYHNANQLKKTNPVPINLMDGTYEPQQWKSAAEFLLEPWVLIQMPFQPALLHQWAVALLTEALLFQKKISSIFSYGCPKKYFYVSELLRMVLKALKKCANFTLFMYMMMCLESGQNNFHATLNKNIDEFLNHYVNYLPIIEFVTSKEADAIIWSIDKYFLRELNRGRKKHPPQLVISDSEEEPTPLYDFWYWTKKCDLQEAFAGVKGDRGRCNDPLLHDFPSGDHECTSECECPRIRKIMRYICERLLRTKRLAGVDVETIMGAIEKHIATDFYQHILNMEQFSQNATHDNEKIDEELIGFRALSNILCLYAEAKVHEIFNLLTRRIFDIVKKLHPEVIIGNSVESRPTTEYSMSDIETKFELIFANVEWTWENILADAVSSCGSLEEISIDNHPATQAQDFQTRIRKLVLNIAKHHFTSLKAGNFEFFSEHQFVQYLLPCFINCILSVLMDASKSQKTKRKCVSFVENLIANYEHNYFMQALSTKKKCEIQNRGVRYCDGKFNFQTFLSKFSTFINDDDLIPTFKYFLSNYARVSENKNADLERGLTLEYSKWFIHIEMFLHRAMYILHCFDNLEDGGQREPVMLSGCISRAFGVEAEKFISNFPMHLLYNQFLSKLKPCMMSAATANLVQKKAGKVNSNIIISLQMLSCQQLAALFVFFHFGDLELYRKSQWQESELQGPGFPFDMASVFAWCIATNDRWKIKQLVGPILMAKRRREKYSQDSPFISIEMLKSNQCFARVLEKISPDGTKVLMKEKGEITFVPVKHCRWCGLIEVEKFRLCSLCEGHSEYCDVNYFCSDECAKNAFVSKHREEHNRYFIERVSLYR